MRPSGRTGTARVSASFLQTMIWSTSSGPMMYDEGSTGAAVVGGVVVSAPANPPRSTSTRAQATVSVLMLPPSRRRFRMWAVLHPKSVSACRGTVGDGGRTQQYLGG